MRIVLLGAPGSGKGTLAEILCKHFSIGNVSTGNIIRQNIQQKNELGNEIAKFVKNGELIPDNIVCAIVKDYLKNKDFEYGYVLDGFPRTRNQAEELEKIGITVDAAVMIDVSDQTIIDRLTRRLQCSKCGKIYNAKLSPSKLEGICDKCGGNLVTRDDDNIVTIQNRIKVYRRQIEPIMSFYKEKNLLKIVPGNDDAQITFKDVLNVL